MKIRCEKCGVHLDLAGYAGRTDVLTVKCTQCGHLIRGVEMTSESAVTQDMVTDSWRIRRQNGDLLAFDGLKTLRRWVSEGRVGADDQVSADGRSWRPLSTLMDDPELGLRPSKPKGPPPIPSAVFQVPDNTLDSPDPEEELDASILSIDGGEFPDDVAPLPRAVSASLGALGANSDKSLAGAGPMSTATGFVPLPSTAPDAEEHGIPLDDMPTINRQLSEGQQESLRTLDDQPTLRYAGQAPEAEPEIIADDDLEEPSLEQAVEHLVTSDHLPSLKVDQLTFADERDDAPSNVPQRSKQGGRIGAFVAGVALALLLGGVALHYGGFLKLPTTKSTPTPVSPIPTTPQSTVTRTQLETFAQAVSDSRSGTEAARKSALETYDVLLKELGNTSGARSLKASIHLERARTHLAGANALKAALLQPEDPNQSRATEELERASAALVSARSLNGKPESGALVEIEILALRGRTSAAKALLERSRVGGLDGAELSRLQAQLEGKSPAPPAGAEGKASPQKGNTSPADAKESQAQAKEGLTTEKTGKPAVGGVESKSLQKTRAGNGRKSRTKDAPAKAVDFDSAMKKGYQFLERGRVAKAREAFLSAARARPDRPEPHANLGWCALESRKYDGAIKFFRKALSVRKRYSDGLFGLGVAFEKKGSTKDAVNAFTEYLKHHPNGRKAYMIKDRLERLRP